MRDVCASVAEVVNELDISIGNCDEESGNEFRVEVEVDVGASLLDEDLDHDLAVHASGDEEGGHVRVGSDIDVGSVFNQKGG